MKPEAPGAGGTTIVANRKSERALMWVGFPLLGIVLGALLKSLADWMVALPWVPFEGPAQLIASLPDTPARIGGAAIGLVAGLVVAAIGESESVKVTITDETATIERDEQRTAFARSDTAAVFKDGKRLVALDPGSAELAGQPTDLSAARLAAAFRAHGYPWCADGDPHAGEYRRWVEGLPELSASAHALFAARARALRKDGSEAARDAEELRAELAKLGLVVRDERKAQYWRTTGHTASGNADAGSPAH